MLLLVFMKDRTQMQLAEATSHVDQIEHCCKIQIQMLKRKQILHTNITRKQFHMKERTLNKSHIVRRLNRILLQSTNTKLGKKTNTACKLLHSSLIKDCTQPLAEASKPQRCLV